MLNWLRSIFTKRASAPASPEPQLEMLRDHLDDLPPVVVPDGYELRTYEPGDEAAWCEIMEGNVGRNWTVERCRQKIVLDPRFAPANLFFATREGRPVASACAWRRTSEDSPIGTIHMVAALAPHRGRGLGHLLNSAVLRRLKELGFRKAYLLSDDWRLPAIHSYLRAGFQPFHTHISHAERWEAVFRNLEDHHGRAPGP